MTVQFNTSNNIHGGETMNERLTEIIKTKLDRFTEQTTRIEAHLKDTNGDKDGKGNDKHCVLEARLDGMQPIAVSHEADTYDEAVTGAANKLKHSLDKAIDKMRNR